MSATNFVTYVPVFEGAQGKYYIVNDKKYSVYFPIAWAHEHIIFQDGEYMNKSGPEDCGNCDAYGSIRGVFVGYCSNCLRNYLYNKLWRGCLMAPGLSVDMLEDNDMWSQYPYMSGVKKIEIGDEEGADLTDQGVNLERLSAAIAAAHEGEDEEVNEELDGNDDECDSLPTNWEEEGEWCKVPDEAQGSTKNLLTWMEKIGLLKEPATNLSFGENLLPRHEPHYNTDEENTYTSDSEE